MSYSINADSFTRKGLWTLDEILPMLAKIGFSALDITPSYQRADWNENAYKVKELCGSFGFEIHQTHAPFNRYGTHGDKYTEYLRRAYEITKIVDAKYFVVHGEEFDFDKYEPTYENMLEYNYRLFAPYVERAEADGIKLAFECVFQEDGMPTHRFCSKLDELQALIEKFNSKNVCCCWDFGHANLAFGEKHVDAIRSMGSLIECTHIHDNYYERDLHLPVFMGKIDWEACRKAFREIGYSGNYNLEISMSYWNIPRELTEYYAKFMYDGLDRFVKG